MYKYYLHNRKNLQSIVELEKFKAIFENSPISIEIYDREGNLIAANKACFSMFGIPDFETIKGYNLFFDPKLPKEKIKILKEGGTIIAESCFNFDEMPRKTKKSGKIWLNTYIGPVFKEGGKEIIGYQLQAQDITNYKKFEEALQKSEKKFKTLAENAPDAIMRINKNRRVIYLNPEVEKITGIKTDQFIGKTNEEMDMPRHLCNLWNKIFKITLRSKKSQNIQFDFPGPAGIKTYDLRVIPEFAADGSVESFLGISRDISRENKIKKELIDTKNYLDNLLNYANAPIIVWNPKFKITLFNHAFERLTGRKSNEVLGEELNILFPKDSKEKSMEYIRKAVAGLRWETVEIPILHKTGDIRIVLWNSANLYAPDGKTVSSTIAQGQDITERKLAEDALKQDKEQIENLLVDIASERDLLDVIKENTEAQLAYLDKDFNFLKVNSAYCRGSNYAESELIGKNHFDLFPNKENKMIFEKVRDTGKPVKFFAKPFAYKNQPEKGVTYWDWTLIPVKDDKNLVKGLVLSVFDVTNRILAEKKLENYAKELEKLNINLKNLQLAVENASDIILITDPDGKILFVNKAVEKLLGYKAEEVIGKKTNILGGEAPPKFFQKLWQTVNFKKKVFSGEIVNKTKNGEKFWAELNVSPVLDDKKNVICLIGIERNITDRKEVDQAKTEFISLAAHQLRTPLATISLSLEMLLRGIAGDISKDQKQYLKEIFNNTHKMAGLIDLFLNVSRIELGRLEVDPKPSQIIEIAKELEKEILPQCNEKKQKFKTYFEENLPTINIDYKILHIALENILANAVKYTPKGGKIYFKIEKTEEDIIFQISDTGYGIPKEQKSLLFTKLFRGNNVKSETEGIGLGLYITKNMIEQSGGKVWVKSEEDKGSEFYISIPLSGMKKKSLQLKAE
ncbi:MAG: PAS domain S-box protein [Candidatus Pacebacteria bacterium]|nr:PAS domain S-box protein [Candidatus Paceibacterota bacterium]